MGSLLLRPFFLRPQFLCAPVGLGLSFYTYNHLVTRRPYRLDGGAQGANGAYSYSYSQSAKTPVVTREGRLNPSAVRQVSLGSITGLCAGLLVSTFSNSLAILLGLMLVGVQVASSYGINIIPYARLQKYVRGIDIRSAVQDNAALKVSFGTTFALAGFMSF